MSHSNSIKTLRELITGALGQMDPSHVITRHVSFDKESRTMTIQGESFTLEPGQGIWVLGSGKASAAMAEAIESIFGREVRDGLVITPSGTIRKLNTVQLMEGTHPIPDKNSLAATRELIHLAGKIPKDDVVLYLISGGASALLCHPAEKLELKDLAETHRLLLKSGADIHEMNTVRTALSGVKGGQFLRYLSHVRLFDLIISDVPGNDFQTIGSGPTTPAVIDYDRAYRILKTRDLWKRISHEVRTHIARGMHEYKKMDVKDHPGEHRQFLVSSASMLAEEVAQQIRLYDYEPEILHPAYNLSIDELEERIMDKIRRIRQPKKNEQIFDHEEDGERSVKKYGDETKASADRKRSSHSAPSADRCLIFYGESYVNVTGSGKGGRNQELALRIARHLQPNDGVTFASVGTDGVDGPTDVAGAIVDGQTVRDAKKINLDPDTFLDNNDSYHFFERAGGHIKTGPTGNNLMDLQVVLIN